MQLETSNSRKQNKELVYFMGIDGSGKTTHAVNLYNKLRSNRIPVIFKYYRGVFFLTIPLILLSHFCNLTVKQRDKAIDHKFYLNDAFRKLWPLVYLLDILLFVFIDKLRSFFKYKSLKGDFFVIYHRSLLDVIVDVCADVLNPGLLLSKWGIILTKLLTRGIVFHLDVDCKIAYGRKRDTPSLEYLTIRVYIYRLLSKMLKKLGFKVYNIDTSKHFSSVSKEILTIINAIFNDGIR